MFGSQTLDVAIGLALTFFLIAAAASAVVEAISALMARRATDLEKALIEMIDGRDSTDPKGLSETAVFKSISDPNNKRGIWKFKWGQAKPSYLSAKTFGDAVAEMIRTAKDASNTADDFFDALPAGLRARLEPIVKEVGADATAIRAELESWFDHTMDRLGGAYKRWAQVILFLVGLVIVVAANASAYRIAVSLYVDPTVRAAVTESASAIATANTTSDPKSVDNPYQSVADAVDQLDSLGLPVGWDGWPDGPRGWLETVVGCLVTALLVMLGAPFWFGVLTKLVSLRSAGERPPKASQDPTSATATQKNLTIEAR